MKQFYFLFVGLFLFFAGSVQAQLVGDNVFLQGAYVEVGIAPNGGYGSTLPAPAGYHPYLGGTSFTFYDPAAATTTSSSNFLGFVADYGRDGWTVGSPPFFGDFYLPGDPQEGWAIQIGGTTGAESDAFIPIYESDPTTGFTGGLAGTNISYSNSGGKIVGVWQGTDSTLTIRQTTTLDTTKLFFTITVVITNTGPRALDSIYYLRTVDPDNDETRVGPTGFTTINTVTYQLPDPGNKVMVSATGATYTNAYLGLGTKDCRAKCMIYTDAELAPAYSLDKMYAQTTPYYYDQGHTSTADVGIGLEFNLGTIAAGDSTALSYAYVLNATYIDSALDALNPGGLYVNGTHFDSTDTINLCSYPPDSIHITMPGGGFYHWSWTPDSVVTGSGTNFTVHSDSINTDVVYTITGTNAAGGCDSITYHLSLDHATFSPSSPPAVTYCQNSPSVPLINPPGGTGVLWYTAPTGGAGSPTPPTPSTTIPGLNISYFTETIGLCHSVRTPDTATIIALPPAPYLSDPSPYCQQQTFVPITIIGTDILWYATATGGSGSPTTPVVNTGVPGSSTFYASQTVNGCEGPRDSITIVVLDSIVPVNTYTVSLGCHGDTVRFSNGTRGANRFQWDFGDGTADTSANPVHIYQSQDTFIVKMTAIYGACSQTTFDTIPLIHPLKSVFTLAPNILCQDSVVTFTNASVGGGLSYNWYFGNGATSTALNPTYTYKNSGVYQVMLVATDFVPCHDTAIGTVSVDSLSPISIGLTDSVVCRSTSVTFAGTFTSIGNIGVSWHFGDGDSMLNVNPVVHSYDSYGTDTVILTAHYRACRDTSTSKVVTLFAIPNINLGADTSICPGGEPLTLADNTNNNVKGATWKWNTGETSPSIKVVAPGYYFVKVGINGCYASDTVWVHNDCYMDIPNVFTPNNDGLNDYFFPRLELTKGLLSFKMDIYNRWGQEIFEATTLDGAGWDGKLNGMAQPEGVYVYVIDAVFRDGQKEHRQGNVTLLR